MSVVAAAIHLEKLPDNPGADDILRLDYFDCLQRVDFGVPVFAGRDNADNKVYFVGINGGSLVFSRLLDSIIGELGIDLHYKLVDCLRAIGPWTRIGGYLSNYPRSRDFGRRLAAREIARNYHKLRDMVLQARAEQV